MPTAESRMFAGPVALIAPENAHGFRDAANKGTNATLYLTSPVGVGRRSISSAA